MYGQRLYGHVSLISHPYGDSLAPPYLGTAILTILCFLQTEEQKPERIYCNCSTPRVIPTATIQEKLPVLGIKASSHYLGQVKASCFYIRQVAVTYRRSTSVVRNLKFLTPFSKFLTIKLFTHHCNLLK